MSLRHTGNIAFIPYPFGSSLKTRGFSAGSGFRFGFNGKENFDKYQDYGFRIYYSELGKFLSTDPLIVFQQKYPELSSFQFASNMPICAIDLDGLEARVYTDNSTIGHAFLSVIDDKGLLHVYTYGQYGQDEGQKYGEVHSKGNGALVHLVGDAAQAYINSEFVKYDKDMAAFEISKEKISKEKIISYFEKEMKGKKDAKDNNEAIRLITQDKTNQSKAVLYKMYVGFKPNETERQDNCVTVVGDGLKHGDFEVNNKNYDIEDTKKSDWYPQKLTKFLNNISKSTDSGVENITPIYNKQTNATNETK